MSIIQTIFAIIIAIAGFPAGLLIARFTREELKAGKRWFKTLIAVCVLAIVLSAIFAVGETALFLIASFVFIILLAIAALTYQTRLTSSRAKKPRRRYK